MAIQDSLLVFLTHRLRALLTRSPPEASGYQPLADAPSPTEDNDNALSAAASHARFPYWRNLSAADGNGEAAATTGEAAATAGAAADEHMALDVTALGGEPLGGVGVDGDKERAGGGDGRLWGEGDLAGQEGERGLAWGPGASGAGAVGQPWGLLGDDSARLLGDDSTPTVLSWENLTCRVCLPQGGTRYVLQVRDGAPVGKGGYRRICCWVVVLGLGSAARRGRARALLYVEVAGGAVPALSQAAVCVTLLGATCDRGLALPPGADPAARPAAEEGCLGRRGGVQEGARPKSMCAHTYIHACTHVCTGTRACGRGAQTV